MSLCFVDTETTGTNPDRHSIWEIALITDSGEYCWVLELWDYELEAAEPMALAVGSYYERSSEAQEPIPLAAFNLVKTNREHFSMIRYISIKDRKDLAQFIAAEIGTSHLVGAVPSFDANFLNRFLRENRLVPSWHYHLVDVEALAAGSLKQQPPWKSRDLYKQLGITDEHFPAHTALGDAKLAKSVYEEVMGLPLTYPEARRYLRHEIL